MATKPKGKLLNGEQLSELHDKNNLKITIDFGNRLDKSKPMSHQDYSEFLKNVADEYKGTPLERVLMEMSLSTELQAKEEPLTTNPPITEFYVSICGGCGCGSRTVPGYAYMSACWCCPKPPNLPPW